LFSKSPSTSWFIIFPKHLNSYTSCIHLLLISPLYHVQSFVILSLKCH
jgi:hypothetical protein